MSGMRTAARFESGVGRMSVHFIDMSVGNFLRLARWNAALYFGIDNMLRLAVLFFAKTVSVGHSCCNDQRCNNHSDKNIPQEMWATLSH